MLKQKVAQIVSISLGYFILKISQWASKSSPIEEHILDTNAGKQVS